MAIEFQPFEDLEFSEVDELRGGELKLNIKQVIDIGLEKALKIEVAKKFWWFDPVWRGRQPRQQLIASGEGIKVQLFNFTSVNLDETKVDQFQRVAGLIMQLEPLVAARKNNLFLISPDPDPYQIDKNIPTNGENKILTAGYIELFPAALSDKPHRIQAVGNFEGTLEHEGGHTFFEMAYRSPWVNSFGWDKQGRVSDAGRLITSYAGVGPEEDFCDSLVAAIHSPEVLDPPRLEFLNKSILANLDRRKPALRVILLEGDDIHMPFMEDPVFYFISKSSIQTMR